VVISSRLECTILMTIWMPEWREISVKLPKSFKIHRICQIQGYRMEDSIAISSRLECTVLMRNLCESYRNNPKHFQIKPKSTKSLDIRRIYQIQGNRLEDSVAIFSRLECTVLIAIWKPGWTEICEKASETSRNTTKSSPNHQNPLKFTEYVESRATDWRIPWPFLVKSP